MSQAMIDLSGVLATGRELDVVQRLPLTSVDVVFAEPLVVRLHVRRVGSGAEITGRIAGEYASECARCLQPVREAVDLEVDERVEPGIADPFSESNVLSDHMLNVDDLTRQIVNAALPIAILCSETCPGLCPTCGERRDSEACRCVAGVLEVPWQI